jgi:precorrin-6B methylase 1
MIYVGDSHPMKSCIQALASRLTQYLCLTKVCRASCHAERIQLVEEKHITRRKQLAILIGEDISQPNAR